MPFRQPPSLTCPALPDQGQLLSKQHSFAQVSPPIINAQGSCAVLACTPESLTQLRQVLVRPHVGPAIRWKLVHQCSICAGRVQHRVAIVTALHSRCPQHSQCDAGRLGDQHCNRASSAEQPVASVLLQRVSAEQTDLVDISLAIAEHFSSMAPPKHVGALRILMLGSDKVGEVTATHLAAAAACALPKRARQTPIESPIH